MQTIKLDRDRELQSKSRIYPIGTINVSCIGEGSKLAEKNLFPSLRIALRGIVSSVRARGRSTLLEPLDDNRTYQAFLIQVPTPTAADVAATSARPRNFAALLFAPIAAVLAHLVSW